MDIGSFESLFTQKTRLNTEKRILAIEEYFAENHAIDISFNNDANTCLHFILQMVREDAENEIIMEDIASIVLDRYSVGDPYSLAGLSTTMSLNEVEESIKSLFLHRDIIQDNMFFKDCTEVIKDEVSEKVEFKCRYIEYYRDPRTDELMHEVQSGTIIVTLDLKNNLFSTSMIGYSKVITKMVNLLKDNFHPQLNISPIYLQQNVRLLANASLADFAPLTLLVINLIFKKLNEMDYIVQSVDSLSFNNENAPRIKNAKLTGTDLFSDPDVVERIYNNDKITKFTVHIMRIVNGSLVLQTSLTIDFRGMIKFIFNNTSVNTYTLYQVCIDLYNGIQELLINPHTLTTGQTLLKDTMQRQAFDTRPQFNAFIFTVRNELLEKIPSEADKINDYFKDNYNVND
ncbi:hypothetical protein [Planococcus koreensis]|uniref:hypothetical protein n=1 Tax=Planococcus koreensis TaxID=112331 RepID=UPI0039FC81CB